MSTSTILLCPKCGRNSRAEFGHMPIVRCPNCSHPLTEENMHSMVAPRKYVMTKLGERDYVLPSNDAKKLFRIRFELDTEDLYEGAPSQGWVVREYNRPLTMPLMLGGSDIWDYWGGPYKTRKEAVDNVLR